VTVLVRPLKTSDLAAVSRIERAITGSGRTGSLARNLRRRLSKGDRASCLAAVDRGTVVGFIVGEIRPWEFGEDREVGWILVVGVDPLYQGKGIGRLLGNSLLKHFRRKGVRRAKTLVEWDAGDVITYFRSLGFARGDAVALEADLH
jgi:predicted N-acetyltransferase YhbS